jgi:ATP-dependent Clp protease ATP-binding subunit ClpA
MSVPQLNSSLSTLSRMTIRLGGNQDLFDRLERIRQSPSLLQHIPDSVGNLEFEGHHNGPSFDDPSSAILRQYDPPHDPQNLDRSEPLKCQVSDRVRYSRDETRTIQEGLKAGRKLFGGPLMQSIVSMPPQDVCHAVCQSLDETDAPVVIQAAMAYLSEVDEERLKQFLQMGDSDALLKAQGLLKDEALLRLKSKGKAAWREILSESTHLFHHILETFIAVTGLNEVGGRQSNLFESNQRMSSYEAQAKLELYITMISYPSLIFGSAFAFLETAAVAALATVIIVTATLIAIPIYIRYLRPCPKEAYKLTNLVQKAIQNETPPTFKRMDVLRQIQDAFLSGKGVLLTAKTGVGKTSVPKSLAELIVAGQCDPFLSKAQLFAGNASQLKGNFTEAFSLTGIEETFKRYPKEFVLFLDEIHSIFHEETFGGRPVDLLLSFSLPQVICATTTEQFENVIANEDAFNRRFQRIELDPLKSQEIQEALYESLHFKAPELSLENGVIDWIAKRAFEYAPNTSQVDGAISLLSCAIVKATSLSFKALEEEINEAQLNIDLAKRRLLQDENPNLDDATALPELDKALQAKKKELIEKQDQLKRIRKIEEECFQLKLQGYQLAAAALKNPLKKKQWLHTLAVQRCLFSYIKEKRNALGLPVGIDRGLVDQIVAASEQRLKTNSQRIAYTQTT